MALVIEYGSEDKCKYKTFSKSTAKFRAQKHKNNRDVPRIRPRLQ